MDTERDAGHTPAHDKFSEHATPSRKLTGMGFVRLATIMQRNTSTSRPQNINIAVIGPPAVGKSALAVRYLTRRFIGEYSSLKDQTYTKCISIEGRSVLLHIVDCCKDTMGPRLDGLMKWSHGILVVFSLTDLTSFYLASTLLQKLAQRHDADAPPFILVANKVDLSHVRCFNYRWGTETAAANGCPYLEVSAAEGLKEVDIAFSSIARLALIRKIRRPRLNPLCIFFLWWKKINKKTRGTTKSSKSQYVERCRIT